MPAGGPSLNPAGRPKRGTSLAERVRWIVDPDEIVAFLLGVVRDGKAKLEARLVAASQLLDRGWGKPLSTVDLAITGTPNAPTRDFSGMSIEARRELLATLRALPITDGDKVPE